MKAENKQKFWMFICYCSLWISTEIFLTCESRSSTIYQINVSVCVFVPLLKFFLTAKEAVQQSIRSMCLFVCLCHSWNSSFKRFTSQSEHSLRLSNQAELYQLKSANLVIVSIIFCPCSLSTSFHFRYHDFKKWLFCSALCFRYI